MCVFLIFILLWRDYFCGISGFSGSVLSVMDEWIYNISGVIVGRQQLQYAKKTRPNATLSTSFHTDHCESETRTSHVEESVGNLMPRAKYRMTDDWFGLFK